MPRRVNKKCIECAQLSAAQARQLHGKQGDDCWREKNAVRAGDLTIAIARCSMNSGGCSISSRWLARCQHRGR